MFRRLNDDEWMKTNLTSFCGYLNCDFETLKKTFGEPEFLNDGKTDVEWDIITNDGVVITIYNYKDGKNYLGSHGKSPSEIKTWHVGCHNVNREKVKEFFEKLNLNFDGEF